jgi:hypothetical protein
VSRCLLLLPGLIALSACNPSVPSPEDIDASLRSATATAISVQDPADIRIEKPQRLTTRWEWSAVHAGATYVCSADDSLRLPDCSQVSENPGG